MSGALRTTLLLAASNVFMTFAWYTHLKNLSDRPWFVASLISWGIASFEYLIQVPANRLGHTQMTVSQLKIMQEVITLSVFAPFAVLYINEPLKWDYLWAGACLLGAVCFVFDLKKIECATATRLAKLGMVWRPAKQSLR